MFNRKNELLSISAEFKPALSRLAETPFEWLDCEALERRHGIGRGTLIVLDVIPHGQCEFKSRRLWLDKFFQRDPGPDLIANDRVYLAYQAEQGDNPDAEWNKLQTINKNIGCEFYEGLVAKRCDSLYPMQLRSPDVEFPFWVKHRWKF